MRIGLLTIMLLALAVGCSDANVRGRVTCDGKGVSGVVVSDGVNVTVTGGSGRYRLRSDKENGYVFISVPSISKTLPLSRQRLVIFFYYMHSFILLQDRIIIKNLHVLRTSARSPAVRSGRLRWTRRLHASGRR